MYRGGLVGSLVLIAACGSGSPTSATSQPLRVVLNVRQELGSYTATLQGRTISGTALHRFDLAPGEYELAGQLRALGSAGAIWAVLFTTGEVPGVPSGQAGGVAWNSLRSATGPQPDLTACGAIYSFDGSGTRDIRLRFTVTASRTIGSYCP